MAFDSPSNLNSFGVGLPANLRSVRNKAGTCTGGGEEVLTCLPILFMCLELSG